MMTKCQKRISGPAVVRIDIHIEVLRVDYNKLSSDRLEEPLAAIGARVKAARQTQRERFAPSGDAAVHRGAIQRSACSAA